MALRRSSEEMFPLIKKWELSGQTRADFCAAHGLSMGLFSYWRSKYLSLHQEDIVETASSSEGANSDTNFIPIALSSDNGSIALELQQGAIRLAFYQLPSASYLKELLS